MSNVTCQINHLLEKMTSSDKDYRFMATNDLMTELQIENIKLDDESEKKVMLMLLHQLKDQNSEVQNLAIKCLGFLIHKVKENQIKYIINSLCTNLLSDNEQLRDISSVGLKTVISEFPLASNTQTANICQRIVGVLSNSIDKQDVSIQLEILDILADLLSRFGSYLISYDSIIINSLLPLLRSPRQAIRKRTIVALSYLSLFCNPELYEKLVNYLSAELVSTSQVSLVLTIIQCIVAVCRQAGHRFGDYVERIISLINNHTYCENDEIREHCLQGFEVFIIKCPKEISPHIGKIIDLCLQLISYDPNYNHDHDEENGSMQIEEEDVADSEESNEYSDDEDMSWKIRRSAAKCLEAAILTRHELLSEFYKTVSPILIARFKEREESVKSDIFHAYIALLKQTKASLVAHHLENLERNELPVVLLEDQVPLIMDALQTQIKDKSIKTRQDCFHLLKELVSILPGCLSNHMIILISGVQYSLGDKNSNINMKINTLTFIHHLLTTHPPEVFHPHMDMLIMPVIAAVNDSFYKIAAEALLVLQQLIIVLRPLNSKSAFDFTIYVNDVYACTFMRLKSSAIDQEVKERAISCMGQIISILGDYLLEKNSVCLPIFLDRLKNEITRLTTVKALKMIAASPLQIDLFIINETIPILGSFLHKNQRALKLLTLSLLDTLVQNYSSAIDTSLLRNLVDEVPPLLNESDLHIAQLTMTFLTSTAKYHSAALTNVRELIFPEISYLVKSPLLQNTALESMTQFFQALITSEIVNVGQQDILKMLINLVENDGSTQMLHKQVYHSLAKCVAAVTVVSDGEALIIVQQFISDIDEKNDAKHVFALLAIGEIGRYIDLSSLEQLNTMVLNSFSQNSEEIKLAASYAMGNIANGNLPHYLPFVLEAIENQPKKQYLLLHSLKEIINNHSTSSEEIEKLLPFVPIIWKVLFKHCECNEEGTRNIVSECLGKLTLIDPINLLPYLQDSLTSTSPLMRATVITAVKFTISDQPQPIDQLLLKSMGHFLNMLNDVDLNVRRVTLLTFNSAAHNKAFLIRNLLDSVLPNLYNATIVNLDLIREIEMGPFKHTVDDGLDLRKAAFECMNTLLDSCLDKLDIFEFLNHLEYGMRDHYDIKILTYLMAARLAQLCPNAVLQRVERLIEPLRITFTIKLKSDAVKQEYEKQDELRRSAMRTVVTWLSIPDADKNPRLSDFISHIKSTTDLNKIFESIQKDISGRMDCFTLEQNFNI